MNATVAAFVRGGEGVLVPHVLVRAFQGDWAMAAAYKRLAWWWSEWEGVQRDGHHWIAVSRVHLAADLCVSEDAARRILSNLVQAKAVVKGGPWRYDGTPMSHYRVDADWLERTMGEIPNQPLGVDPPSERVPAPSRLGAGNQSSFIQQSYQQYEQEDLSTDVDLRGETDSSFTAFWEMYPRRNGKRLGRSETFAAWKRMRPPERAAAGEAVVHYAAAVADDLYIAKDPHRWLRGRCWGDWQEPAVRDERGWGSPRASDSAAHRLAMTIQARGF